jgi:transposase InsO family protein
MCEVLKVSGNGFYSWRNRPFNERTGESIKLIPLVRQIHSESGGTYGTRRIAKALQALGIRCGRSRARTLMKMADVAARQRKKFRVTTDSKHNLPVAPNLLDRRFEVKKPNKVWVSDITYVWTAQGWLYLTVVLDLFSRQIVGWAMDNRINRKLVMNALRMAIWHRRPVSGLMFHSDRGSQYCSHDFQRLLRTHKMTCSMSRKGDCWDNAVVESFFGSLKKERIFPKNYRTREEAKKDIIDYIEMFYNSRRQHSYLGYVSPREFENRQFIKKAA